MRNLFFICLICFLFSCSNNSNTTAAPDSANAIDNNTLDTVTSSSQPDGYAPPNTKVDTSQARKDSINARKQ